MRVIDFRMGDYQKILDQQTMLFQNLVASKREHKDSEEYILIGEHPAVITLGRKAKENNIISSPQSLKEKGIGVYHIGRGGDVTFHCPGQLVVYPILDLEKHCLGVKDYVSILEESVIRLLRNHGIKGERVENATGVWIGKGTKNERKISAIGIKCSRFCTMHGISLNVNNDLQGFSMINPCGFIEKGVTSMEMEGVKVDINEIKKEFLDLFLSLIFPLKEVFNFTE